MNDVFKKPVILQLKTSEPFFPAKCTVNVAKFKILRMCQNFSTLNSLKMSMCQNPDIRKSALAAEKGRYWMRTINLITCIRTYLITVGVCCKEKYSKFYNA